MNDRANPAPLGLMGFGMTTVLLNLHNAGYFKVGAMILAMGFFYGGLAQVIAGIMEFRKNNTFGLLAFTSFGSFWITLGFIWVFTGTGSSGGPGGLYPAENADYFGWYLFLWGLFTAYMFLNTLNKNRALQVIFGTLVILFWLLAVGDWTGNETITKIAGWEGIVCGLSAIYLAAAEVFKETYGREILPIGQMK
jgi:succinate-acetate transporter protein